MVVKTEFTQTGEKSIINQFTLIEMKHGETTQVEWLAVANLKWYPWEKFAGIFMDQMAGPGYEAALRDLKAHCEK
jgi:hypothetical protein